VRVMYCWRCGLDVAMLNEEEFLIIEELYAKAVRAIKAYGRTRDPDMDVSTLNDRTTAFILEQYRPILEEYRRITGQQHLTQPADLMHHRISIYGPDCSHCGKPLRTPRATYCAACGADR
jgi:hypothetical protein